MALGIKGDAFDQVSQYLILFFNYCQKKVIQQASMRGNRSQTFKINNGQPKIYPAVALRTPRESQPYMIYNGEVDHLFLKNSQELKQNKRNREGRISQIFSTTNYSEQFFSPKFKKNCVSPSAVCLSPPGSKKQKPITKCTSSNNLFTQSQQFTNGNCKKNINKIHHNNHDQAAIQNKNRNNLIENHKKTLGKIQQMLMNYGVNLTKQKDNDNRVPNNSQSSTSSYSSSNNPSMATSVTNTPMQQQLNSNTNANNINNAKKSVIKSPRFSEQLIPDYDLQLGRKQTESFGNQKKQGNNNIVPINQIRELKETVSTNSTLKNVKTLKIGDFQIGKQVGRGRFGIVKIVKHKKTGLIFAMKIIKKQLIKKQDIVEQFIKEIKIQYFLNQANIVKLYTVFDDKENCYLLLELCCEGNLYQKLVKQKKFEQSQARSILRNVCEGLAQLHQNKIIHRDLKPQNIVMSYGLAKLCDFGWSTQNRDTLRSTFCGTPLYVSPQLLIGQNYDEKVDQWSIGILGYQMMTGNIPFDIKTEKDLGKIVESKIVYPKSLSSESVQFLECLLSKDPMKRKRIVELLDHPFFHKKHSKNHNNL